MRLRDSFDIPEGVARGPHSPAFETFLWNWFGGGRGLIDGDLDKAFLKGLTPEELELARDLVRRNLSLRYDHIIEAVSALNDVAAAPILRRMLAEEMNDSRRLVIAGTLWKIARDPVFVELLNRAKGNQTLSYMVVSRALWLDDFSAIDFLIDLLPEEDRESELWLTIRYLASRMPFRPFLMPLFLAHAHKNSEGSYALGFLNRLEFGRHVQREMKHPPSYYRVQRNEPVFRNAMTAAVHRWNAEWSGRSGTAAE